MTLQTEWFAAPGQGVVKTGFVEALLAHDENKSVDCQTDRGWIDRQAGLIGRRTDIRQTDTQTDRKNRDRQTDRQA